MMSELVRKIQSRNRRQLIVPKNLISAYQLPTQLKTRLDTIQSFVDPHEYSSRMPLDFFLSQDVWFNEIVDLDLIREFGGYLGEHSDSYFSRTPLLLENRDLDIFEVLFDRFGFQINDSMQLFSYFLATEFNTAYNEMDPKKAYQMLHKLGFDNKEVPSPEMFRYLRKDTPKLDYLMRRTEKRAPILIKR